MARRADDLARPDVEVLQGLCHAVATASSKEQASERIVEWVRAAVGRTAQVQVYLPAGDGELRSVSGSGSFDDPALRAKRSFAFRTGREVRIDLGYRDAVAVLPLTSGGRSLGILELVADRAVVAGSLEILRAAASQATIAYQHLPAAAEAVGARSVSLVAAMPVGRFALELRAEGDDRPSTIARARRHRVTVLIMESHKLFAEVLRAALEREDMRVAGVVDSETELVALAREESPDLVLIGLGSERDGQAVGEALRSSCPAAKLVAIVPAGDPRATRDGARTSFHAHLSKDLRLQQFVAALWAALEGRAVSVKPGSAPRAATGGRLPEERDAALLARHVTPREREVLALMVEGASSTEMAERLSVSPNTIRTHVQSILTKLQVHSRLEAATFAVRHGLVKVGRHRSEALEPPASAVSKLRAVTDAAWGATADSS